jgi:D-alanine-D-alanine ligase
MDKTIGRRIGVLMGGSELSLATGEAVFAALTRRGHDVVKIFVDQDVDLALRAARIDVAFLALHGRLGEDGCVQGLLEVLRIPYTGSSVLTSALAMDKVKAKELFRQHNLPTPAYYVHRRGAGDAAMQHGGFGFPAVVKPRAESSSLGVQRVDDSEELDAAIDEALAFDDDVLVERFIDGTELHVAVLGGRAIGAVEIATAGGLLDHAARRGARPLVMVTPPRLGAERLRGIYTVAERACESLEARGLVEVDIVLSERGNEYILEVDTLPQLSEESLIARVARATGIEFGALVEAVLAEARLHAGGRAGVPRGRRQPEQLAVEHH